MRIKVHGSKLAFLSIAKVSYLCYPVSIEDKNSA